MQTPGFAPFSFLPRYRTVPGVRAVSPAIDRSNVLLLEPLRPTSATI